MEVSTIGLDLAKRVFQVHGVDAEGQWCCEGVSVGRWWFMCSHELSVLAMQGWANEHDRAGSLHILGVDHIGII